MFNVWVFIVVYLLMGVMAGVTIGIIAALIWKNGSDLQLRAKAMYAVNQDIKEENSFDFFHRVVLPIIGFIIWPLSMVYAILVVFCITKMNHQELIDEFGEEAKEG